MIQHVINLSFIIRYQGVVDGTIGLVMKKRRLRSQIEGLTEQDVFFREVCFAVKSFNIQFCSLLTATTCCL